MCNNLFNQPPYLGLEQFFFNDPERIACQIIYHSCLAGGGGKWGREDLSQISK